MALLVVAKALPAMQRPAAQVEFLGVEGRLDLPPLRLRDQPLVLISDNPVTVARGCGETSPVEDHELPAEARITILVLGEGALFLNVKATDLESGWLPP